jgi:tetratricopeptide (TPR) repeat protein
VVTSNLYLSKLRQTQSEQLLKELVDRTISNDGQAVNEMTSNRLSELADRTGGNPLFIEELAKSVSRSDDNVPGSIQDTLIARLDNLGSARELAQIAAVIGRNFKRSLLRQCNGVDQADFNQRFNTLVQAEIFYPSTDEDQWYFKHALIRDAAYQTLHDDSRQSLHGTIASTIEEHDAQTIQNQPSLLAQHWELNGNLPKAVSFWQKSAQRNLTLFAISESIEQCEHALELSKQLGQDQKAQQLVIYSTLGPALMNRFGYADDRAGKAYAKALELSQQFKGQVPIINIMFGNWTYRCVRAEHLNAYPLSQEMIRISKAAGVRSEICESYMVQGINDFYRGEFLDARKTLQTAIDHYDRDDSVHHIVTYGQNPFIPINNFQSWNELALGEIEKAVHHAMASVSHARETNHPMTLAYALSFATYVFMNIDDFEEAEKLVTESIRICTENDVILFLGLSLILQALLFFNRDEIEAGEQAMARASEVYLPTGAQVMIPNFLAVQAEVLLKAGRLQEAEELINQSLEILEHTRENWCLAPVQAIKCMIHKLKQETEIAAEYMHKLVETLTYQHAEGIRMLLLQKGFEIPELEPQSS